MGQGLVAVVGGTWMAPWASPPPAALAALPVNADQDAAGILQAGGVIEGVSVCALGSLRAGGTTKGVALHAPAPCLYTRLLKPLKWWRPQWPDPAQLSAQMAVPVVLVLMAVARRLSRLPSLRLGPRLLPTPT